MSFLRPVSFFVAILVAGSSSTALAQSEVLPNLLIAQAGVRQPLGTGQAGGLRNLNLTPQQIKDMQAIRTKYQPRLTQQRQALQQAMQALRQLMVGNASPDQIRKQHAEVSRLRQQLESTRFESMLEVRDILTPEQRLQFDQQLQQRREGMKTRLRQRINQPGASNSP